MPILESKTYIATPPGETIKEQLSIHNMTAEECAYLMHLSETQMNHLLNSEISLTPGLAHRLEDVFTVPAYFWNNLERRYREKPLLVEEESLYINLGFWLALKVFGVMFSKTFFFYSCGLCFWGA